MDSIAVTLHKGRMLIHVSGRLDWTVLKVASEHLLKSPDNQIND